MNTGVDADLEHFKHLHKNYDVGDYRPKDLDHQDFTLQFLFIEPH